MNTEKITLLDNGDEEEYYIRNYTSSKYAETSLTRRIQLLCKEMMQIATEICQRYGIHYYVVEGTLLGTVRHKGFIPWDDDIDIGIPNTEVEKFVEICRSELPESFYIECPFDYEQSAFNTGLAKICSSTYKVLDISGRVVPISIDIGSIIGMPSGKLTQKRYYYQLLFHRAISRMCRPNTIAINNLANQTLMRKFVISIARKVDFSKIFSFEKQIDKLKRYISKYSYDSCDFVMYYPSYYGEKEIVEKSFYGDGVTGEFEGIKVRMPTEYHKLLTCLYGDYMTLPPEDHRIGSHVQKILEE